MPPLVERSPARARPLKSQERCHLILSHLPWIWQYVGGTLYVVSMDRCGAFLFSSMSCMFDTCTRGLPALEPHRSSPKSGVSDVPTAKGFSKWSEQSPLLHARVPVSFNTNPCTSRFGVSQFPLFPLSCGSYLLVPYQHATSC